MGTILCFGDSNTYGWYDGGRFPADVRWPGVLQSLVPPEWRVIAFEVADTERTTSGLAAGAEVVAGPTPTPWSSLNARLDAPGALHITLFEELS